MDDTITKASYMLSDLSVIPTAPNLKQLPPFDVKIELTKEFTSKFIKAKNALPEADNFAVESDGTNTNIIINYSNVNTNKISFKATTLETSSMSPVCFSAKLFKEILEANKDCTGTLEISSKGLGRVTFSNKEFSTVYYLVKLSIN
jgi:ribosome maturation factor RimP